MFENTAKRLPEADDEGRGCMLTVAAPVLFALRITPRLNLTPPWRSGWPMGH